MTTSTKTHSDFFYRALRYANCPPPYSLPSPLLHIAGMDRAQGDAVTERSPNLWVIILAGGDGRRLGSLTADASGVCTPKQFCSLNGGPSLLQMSLDRALRHAPRERIVVVVTAAHRRWWEPALWPLRRSGVIVQPSNRGTGLGVLLPLLVIAKSDPTACVLCLPSDHYVANEDVLSQSIRQASALHAADFDKVTLLGMSPTAPDPGFGYLAPATDSRAGIRAVQSFIEKPDSDLAAQIIRDGGVWNSGIFAGLIQVMLDLYPRHVPGLLRNLKSVVDDAWFDPQAPWAPLESLYASCPVVDFSRDVLERQPARLQFLTVPPCGWSDVGTPARLATTLQALPSQCVRGASFTSSGSAFNLETAFTAAPTADGRGFAPEAL